MGRIILFNMVSLDGFFEGKDKDISWHNIDNEFLDFSARQLNDAGTLLFGRVTYSLMSDYWQTPEAFENAPAIAEKMTSISKIVFSNTLEKAGWVNTLINRETLETAIGMLKQSPADVLIFGSADLAASLIKLNLIDEYRLMLNPVILGGGKPLFKEGNTRLGLKLVKTTTYSSGNVLLIYEPNVKVAAN